LFSFLVHERSNIPYLMLSKLRIQNCPKLKFRSTAKFEDLRPANRLFSNKNAGIALLTLAHLPQRKIFFETVPEAIRILYKRH